MTAAIAVSSLLSALLLALALVLPSITSPTVPFGVRVPVQRADDPTVASQTRIYRRRVASCGIAAAVVPSMPDALAVHHGANGAPNRLAAKSVVSAFSLVFVQIGVTGLLVGIAAAIFHSRPDLDPARPLASARWYRQYMSLGVKALLGLVPMIDVGMLGSSLLMWTGTVTPWAGLVVALPILAAVVVAIVVLARNNRERDEGERDTGLTHRDDDKYWRGGLVYINREDHALMVPRRFGLGWTLNFGNPRSAMLLAGVFAQIGVVITFRFGS
ncbi:DUF5808 domain-containing protein [Arthrobacter sp. I3]|uniref:DUF5808 domain-containing protein n=1 Tax=Arthrobacter sp. I3 TaxID=218158 RepID=UPI000482F3EB|nr:DUF5808 domain-containing protein [Arthrobacter sp. I3]